MIELAAADDENPVEAVGTDRAYPTLGEGVGVRSWTGVRITLIPSVTRSRGLSGDQGAFEVAK
jgi:hypothetical protein